MIVSTVKEDEELKEEAKEIIDGILSLLRVSSGIDPLYLR